MIFNIVAALFIFFVVLPIAFGILGAVLGFFSEVVADMFRPKTKAAFATATIRS